MRKKQLLFTLAALTILSLSGCHKDKPVTKTEPLETIAPETQSETISDKLDDTADTLEIHGLAIDPDGNVISEQELDEILAGEVENSASENNESQSDNSSETDEQGATAGSSESSSETEMPTLSEEDLAKDRVDITPEQYQEIQDEIDEWTIKQAEEDIRFD